jgi:hypothetical protein
MSINKALNQVMMYEEIGGKKKENPQPTDTTPVKMPEAPRPAGPKPKSTRGVNAPPPKRPLPFPVPSDTTRETQPSRPIKPRPVTPTDGGAEVTPPQGLAEKAFWKQRLTNQLNEKRQLGVLTRAAGEVLGHYWGPWGDMVGKLGDKWKEHEDDKFREITHDYDNPESPYYNPNRDVFRNFPLEARPVQGQGTGNAGGWAGGNSQGGENRTA